MIQLRRYYYIQQTVIHNKQIERLSDSYNSDMLMG